MRPLVAICPHPALRATLLLRAVRHFCRLRDTHRFTGELPRKGSLFFAFLGFRCKYDEARIGRKDTIDLYGHCSLSDNAETKSGVAYKP